MNLCISEGALDFAFYRALSTDVPWPEAQRIAASMVVVGDERERYQKWLTDDAARRQTGKGTGMPMPGAINTESVTDEIRELQAKAERIEEHLTKHRRWVMSDGEHGKALTSEQLSKLEQTLELHRQAIEVRQNKLASLKREAS